MMENEKMQTAIPKKAFFKAGEVSALTGVKPYILRYWESEFDRVHPTTSGTGQKMFSLESVEWILKIKEMLFEQKISIEDVKKELAALTFKKIESDKGVELEIPKLPTNSDLSAHLPMSSKLSDRELQKLILAKAKLKSLINFANTCLS